MNTQQLLDALDAERLKFTQSDKQKMEALCNQLVELGVYPAVSKSGFPALTMVEGWGVHWHEWQEPFNCPHCNADLRDHDAGPPFKRELAFYQFDRTTHYNCPDCKGRIERVWIR